MITNTLTGVEAVFKCGRRLSRDNATDMITLSLLEPLSPDEVGLLMWEIVNIVKRAVMMGTYIYIYALLH